VIEMVVNHHRRAGVAVAGIARSPVATRAGRRASARRGAAVFGLSRAQRVACEWAAGQLYTVRELDFHDTFSPRI
jgi:hypothetical protein